MNEYGIMINGQLIKHPTRQEGDKPVVFTIMPTVGAGQKAVYQYEDAVTEIRQVWIVVPDTDVPDPTDPTDTDKAEAFDILTGGAE